MASLSRVGWLSVCALAACGYEATPLVVGLDLNGSATTVRGVADPDASRFDTGVVVWTRWPVAEGDSALVELAIDLRRDLLPSTIAASDPPATLSSNGGGVRATVRQRGADGTLRTEVVADAVTITVQDLVTHGSLELSRGTFNVTLPAGLYPTIAGTWVSEPTPEDAASDSNMSAPIEESDSGGSSCDCGGASDTSETRDDNTTGGGSGCAGDSAGDDEEPSPSDESSTEDTGGGCDCQGDTSAATSQRHRVRKVRCGLSPSRAAFEASPLVALYGLSRRRRRWFQ